MKKLLVLLCSLALVFGLAASVGAVTIDFEDLNGSAYLPVGYAGLTWDPEWVYYDNYQPPYFASSGDERIYTHNYGGWIKFGQDVTFLGSWVASYDDGQTMYWEGYQDGNLLYTSAALYGGDADWINVVWAGVDEVRFVCTTYNHFIIDDIMYEIGGAAVPIPGAIWLLGSGLVGVAGLRRKFKK